MSKTTRPATTVAMIYGFGEDDWNGLGFVAALQKHGYRVIKDTTKADIIISHSAGCFYLPPTGKEQLTVLIGPPYWPGQSMARGFVIKFFRDYRYYRTHGLMKEWRRKTRHNTLYILGGLRKALAIARNSSKHDFYLALQQKRVLIIRNQNDAFLTPNAPKLLAKHANISFETLPGEHDDCWLHPEPYIDLIGIIPKAGQSKRGKPT